MRTVSIRELQMKTRELVRACSYENILITDQGQPVALLTRPVGSCLIGKPFPKRDIRKMPKIEGDSTDYISQERDGR
jgi:antitoxin (DNA-binding transcriptional repressor) of toxin-antitoxin stability system